MEPIEGPKVSPHDPKKKPEKSALKKAQPADAKAADLAKQVLKKSSSIRFEPKLENIRITRGNSKELKNKETGYKEELEQYPSYFALRNPIERKFPFDTKDEIIAFEEEFNQLKAKDNRTPEEQRLLEQKEKINQKYEDYFKGNITQDDLDYPFKISKKKFEGPDYLTSTGIKGRTKIKADKGQVAWRYSEEMLMRVIELHKQALTKLKQGGMSSTNKKVLYNVMLELREKNIEFTINQSDILDMYLEKVLRLNKTQFNLDRNNSHESMTVEESDLDKLRQLEKILINHSEQQIYEMFRELGKLLDFVPKHQERADPVKVGEKKPSIPQYTFLYSSIPDNAIKLFLGLK